MINEKLNVLAIFPISIGGRLTTSSIIDGFKLLNHNIDIFDELKNDDFKNFYKTKNYDLIVGYDFSPIRFKFQYNLPQKCVAYFSDEIQNRTSGDDWENLINYLNREDVYTFYWDRELSKKEKIQNLFYLPHFVNSEIYKPTNENIDNDVMFAGRLDSDYRLNMIEKLVNDLPDVKFSWYAINRHYEDAMKRAKNPQVIKKIYRGFIDNEFDMAKELNKTKIVINMNSQGLSSLNYRTFQTLSCGKLIISDNRKELDLFNNKIPTYSNIADLKELIKYYLSNKSEYQKLTEYLSSIARENHNSIKGVSYILDKINC